MKTTTGPWTLLITAKYPMRSSNVEPHWSGTADARRQWRKDACDAAHKARLPKGLTRIRVDIELVFPPAKRGAARRKKDAPNYYQEIGKRIVDGLGPQRTVKARTKSGTVLRVEPGHGVVADDTQKQVHGPNITISEELAAASTFPFGYALVTVTDLSTPPPIPESGDGWHVISWRDPQGKEWFRHGLNPEQFVDDGRMHGRVALLFNSRTELEAAHGPLTPDRVNNQAALLAELHRTQMRLAGFLVEGDPA